jgi:hypothetical protein
MRLQTDFTQRYLRTNTTLNSTSKAIHDYGRYRKLSNGADEQLPLNGSARENLGQRS